MSYKEGFNFEKLYNKEVMFLFAINRMEFINNRKFAANAVAQNVISYMISYAFLILISLIFLHLILQPSFSSSE